MSKELDEKIAAIKAKNKTKVGGTETETGTENSSAEAIQPETENAGQTTSVSESVEVKQEKLDWRQAEKRFDEVEKYQMTFKGKAGYNPFIWLRDNVLPLRTQYQKGIRTAELHKAILDLTFVEPDGANIKGDAYRLSEILTPEGKFNIPKQ